MKSLAKKLSYLLGCTFAFLIFNPHMLGSETLQITTYYPAPYGGYVRLLTTGDTVLARDGGTRVEIGPQDAVLPRRIMNVNGDMYIAGMIYGACARVTFGPGINNANCRTRCGANYRFIGSQSDLAFFEIRDKASVADNPGRLIDRKYGISGIMICCKMDY